MGLRVGKYVLDRKLGEGGMAQVWLGCHVDLGSYDAIKILGPKMSESTELRARFLREGQRQAGLRAHPAVVKVLGYDEADADGQRIAYLVLEYIRGESLRARLDRLAQEPMEHSEFQRVALRTLDALAFAHSQRLVHRDIKSSNILLDEAGNAFLGDFGLVRAPNEAGLTQDGAILGTSEYMSPEQILASREADARSDIYSFGCVLYEMLAGKTPFWQLKDDFLIKKAHLDDAPLSLVSLNPKISPQMEAIIFKALRKRPEERWQSCEDLRKELEQAAGKTERLPGSERRLDETIDGPRMIDVFDLASTLGRLQAFITLARAAKKEPAEIEDGLRRMGGVIDPVFCSDALRKIGIEIKDFPLTAVFVEALFNRVDRTLRSGGLNSERAWRLGTALGFLLWYRPEARQLSLIEAQICDLSPTRQGKGEILAALGDNSAYRRVEGIEMVRSLFRPTARNSS